MQKNRSTLEQTKIFYKALHVRANDEEGEYEGKKEGPGPIPMKITGNFLLLWPPDYFCSNFFFLSQHIVFLIHVCAFQLIRRYQH